MKFIIVLIICITVVASATTSEKMLKCFSDKQCTIKGNADPKTAEINSQAAASCIAGDPADQCVYMRKNPNKSLTAEWSATYCANFHGCLTKSKNNCRA